jgi:predicted HTH transcriptional regulator
LGYEKILMAAVLGGRAPTTRCYSPHAELAKFRITVVSSTVTDDSFTDADQLVRDLLAQGSELHVDYKTAMAAPRDKRGWAKLAKQVIGFSNHKDGGYLLIGVEDGTLRPIGLTPDEVASWDAAKVGPALAPYARPRPVVQVFRGSLEDGTVLIALRVVPFEEQPLVCTKSINDERARPILRAGAMYIRTEGTETREVSTEGEMRELLGRAYVRKADRLLMEIKALIDAHWPGTAPLPAAALFSAIEQDLTEMAWP